MRMTLFHLPSLPKRDKFGTGVRVSITSIFPNKSVSASNNLETTEIAWLVPFLLNRALIRPRQEFVSLSLLEKAEPSGHSFPMLGPMSSVATMEPNNI